MTEEQEYQVLEAIRKAIEELPFASNATKVKDLAIDFVVNGQIQTVELW